MGTIRHLSSSIMADFVDIFPQMYKNPREKLATMVASVIEARSCNTTELAARLPIESERAVSRYMWIERFLSTSTIDDEAAMEALARRLLEPLSARGQTIIVCLDQTSLCEERAIAMVSARVGERALPLFWTVRKSGGNIPIRAYLPLLERLKACLPPRTKVMLLADRFFGSPELIAACQTHGWSWRIRLKANLTLLHEGGELNTGQIVGMGEGITGADLCASGTITNIGTVHDAGHEEAWIIAMDACPGRKTTLDYGLRWGIEAMFSDCKSRGFGFHKTHLQRTDRISRMLLVITIAMTWAIANGYAVQKNEYKQAA